MKVTFKNGKTWPVKDGRVTALVQVSLAALIDSDLEGFLDKISEEAVASVLLSDISYQVAGVADAFTVILQVEGDASDILADADAIRVQEDGIAESQTPVRLESAEALVARIASLKKWGELGDDGQPFHPSDGLEDSHSCLMDLIDDARWATLAPTPDPGQEAYVLSDGNRCPFCDSNNLAGGSLEVDAGGSTQEVTCASCGKAWFDNYRLVGFSPIQG